MGAWPDDDAGEDDVLPSKPEGLPVLCFDVFASGGWQLSCRCKLEEHGGSWAGRGPEGEGSQELQESQRLLSVIQPSTDEPFMRVQYLQNLNISIYRHNIAVEQAGKRTAMS